MPAFSIVLLSVRGVNSVGEGCHIHDKVSMRGLDLVSLEELKTLATGSVERVRVKRILGRMAS
jgi:hypothetical protein